MAGAGMDTGDLVKVTLYLVGDSDATRRREVLTGRLGQNKPCMTLIVVTHELGFACNVADHVVFLEGRRVHEEGMPRQVLLGPQRERTREFLRSHTLFRLPDARGAAHT